MNKVLWVNFSIEEGICNEIINYNIRIIISLNVDN